MKLWMLEGMWLVAGLAVGFMAGWVYAVEVLS
jgi:hypothetical protein